MFNFYHLNAMPRINRLHCRTGVTIATEIIHNHITYVGFTVFRKIALTQTLHYNNALLSFFLPCVIAQLNK